MEADGIETSDGRTDPVAHVRIAGPYAMDCQPRSPNRVFLARALTHFCCLHRGLSDHEVGRAFADAGEPSSVSYVRMASALLGDLLATGSVRSFARPFGGGEASPLPASVWEVDDVRPRFASCAMDPSDPFDEAAAATHWIFLDLDDFNEVLEASVADVVRDRPARSARAAAAAVPPAAVVVPAPPLARTVCQADDRLLRLPEVERRTGLSKSTIYRRIADGRFPATVPLAGNMALWRESEVAGWIAEPV